MQLFPALLKRFVSAPYSGQRLSLSAKVGQICLNPTNLSHLSLSKSHPTLTILPDFSQSNFVGAYKMMSSLVEHRLPSRLCYKLVMPVLHHTGRLPKVANDEIMLTPLVSDAALRKISPKFGSIILFGLGGFALDN